MYWTTEQVADHLAITPAQVYESRKRKEYPGNLGRLRGRRLMFDAAQVQNGPTEPETLTWEEAVIEELRGISKRLDKLIAIQPQYVELVTEETTVEEEK